jgi:molybdopterin synthase sulfur carrier subunit
MAMVTLRYWAAAKAAAGVPEEKVAADTLAAALARALAGGRPDERGAQFRAVLARSSFLIDGQPVGGRAPDSVALADGAVIEVLPPFAGG